MKDRTLSFLILFFCLLGIISYLFMGESIGLESDRRRVVSYIFAVSFGAVPLLIIQKIVSRLFLSGLSRVRLSTLEGLFVFYYPFLTKEAREEWRACIEEKKGEHN